MVEMTSSLGKEFTSLKRTGSCDSVSFKEPFKKLFPRSLCVCFLLFSKGGRGDRDTLISSQQH